MLYFLVSTRCIYLSCVATSLQLICLCRCCICARVKAAVLKCIFAVLECVCAVLTLKCFFAVLKCICCCVKVYFCCVIECIFAVIECIFAVLECIFAAFQMKTTTMNGHLWHSLKGPRKQPPWRGKTQTHSNFPM